MFAYWSNRVVLVTGASSGIGRGLATELARRGAAVGLLARRADALQEIVEEIVTAGGQAIPLPADVTDEQAVRRAVNELKTKLGPVDVLFANAGVGITAHATSLNPEAVAKLFDVNVIGVVNSVAGVIGDMIQRGQGQLVAISSLAAYRGLPKSAAYCASKAAVSAFFESLRLDLYGSGVEVTIIHPGFIKTPLTAGRQAQLPWLMEVSDAVNKILKATEARKKSYAFPWQLATIVRAGMFMPNFVYDWISRRNSFRE
ncbi:MAG TPA: SDR family NAD(P)-dependent oxidoreductase [Pyrinomonadaceae bacterium]|nr:SDR family NAD(P)-dependent oxidoreductase [Pyrinomonadaceae bacterium]